IRLLNRIAPWVPYKNEDGSYGTVSDGSPMAWLESGMNVKRYNQNFNGLLGVDWQPKPLLKSKTESGMSSQDSASVPTWNTGDTQQTN
ncbi:MAG: hypothetical protein SPL20_09865, partial [Fibrobacter sp.]|nr:hypothetical protein [Fibrobacter sp.]